jgi:hypothetical protein
MWSTFREVAAASWFRSASAEPANWLPPGSQRGGARTSCRASGALDTDHGRKSPPLIGDPSSRSSDCADGLDVLHVFAPTGWPSAKVVPLRRHPAYPRVAALIGGPSSRPAGRLATEGAAGRLSVSLGSTQQTANAPATGVRPPLDLFNTGHRQARPLCPSGPVRDSRCRRFGVLLHGQMTVRRS